MDTSVLLNWIFGGGLLAALTALVTSVSYTHLDVYKRQANMSVML